MQVQNERKFPQAKLDSKINVRFLLNDHGDLYFFAQKVVYIIILFSFKRIEKFYRTEKKIYVKACTKPLLWNANYDRENNDYTNALRPRFFNGVIFRQMSYDIVTYARRFLSGFPLSIALISYAVSYRKI